MKSYIITKLFEDYLIKKKEKEKKEHSPLQDNEFFAGSSGGCSRALYFSKRIGFNPPNDLLKIFCIGNIIHDFIQTQIITEGKSEVPSTIEEDGIVVRGRLDCLLGDVIYEIKTIKSLNYVTNEPKDEHRRQLNIYLNANNLKNGVLLYVEKNTLQTIEHIVTFNQELYDDSIKQFKLVHKAIVNKKPPERLSDYPDGWNCRYCNFRDVCQKGEMQL